MLALLSVAGCAGGRAVAPTGPGGPAPKLQVSGHQIVDATGNPVRLLGVNRSGAEFECVNGPATWDGPVDDAAVAAMASWHVRAVRVALNEDCWLGVNRIHPASSGERYRRAVGSFVATLESHGMAVILDLHWSGGTWAGANSQCPAPTATCQKPMPDARHAPAFWASVAQAFRDDRSVLFDLFNEPFPDALGSMTADQPWDCWLRGGAACPGLTFEAAGMQQLVDAVRATGARNVILASGTGYANDLTGWLSHRPRDPTGNLAAAWHSYDYSACHTAACWDSQIAPVAAAVPVVALEIGQADCARGYVDPLMDWLDDHRLGYLGWTWNAWDCRDGPALISDYDGTPTAYGSAVRARLLAQR